MKKESLLILSTLLLNFRSGLRRTGQTSKSQSSFHGTWNRIHHSVIILVWGSCF